MFALGNGDCGHVTYGETIKNGLASLRVLEQIEGEVVELIEGVGFGGKFERSVLRLGLHAQSSLAGEP